jgi:hypothetical protein
VSSACSIQCSLGQTLRVVQVEWGFLAVVRAAQAAAPAMDGIIDYQSGIDYTLDCVGRDQGVGTVARQPLYRVRFRQGDLWGTTEAPAEQDSVDVEIYQHWLEPAPVSAAAATLAGSRANGSVPAEEHRPAGPPAPTRHHRVRRSVCIHPTLI